MLAFAPAHGREGGSTLRGRPRAAHYWEQDAGGCKGRRGVLQAWGLGQRNESHVQCPAALR